MFIAIIAVLLAAIIYQFVCIKTLQYQLDNSSAANISAFIKNVVIH